MKITDVKLRFAKHYLFVQIYTDAGITGLGEAGNWGYLQATAAAIEKFADYLIGKDPFRIEDFNQNFLRSVYFRGSVIMSAISAIDIALWDIKGKALGVPVYELLGGRPAKKCVFMHLLCISQKITMSLRSSISSCRKWALQLQRSSATVRSAHQMEKGNFIPAALNVKWKRYGYAVKLLEMILILCWKCIGA